MPADPAASPTTTADDPGGRTARWLVVAVALAAVVPVIYLLGTPHNFFDLKIYMSAMRWWANGNPLYDYAQPDRVQGELYFTYPPFTALLMRPFAGLPLGATVTIFTIFTVLAVIVTTWWLIMSIADRRGFPAGWLPWWPSRSSSPPKVPGRRSRSARSTCCSWC